MSDEINNFFPDKIPFFSLAGFTSLGCFLLKQDINKTKTNKYKFFIEVIL
jgi:2-methylaconitate cis-trans-isomerase PrpF